MDAVKAPDGFEGCMWWDDATKTYKVAFREAGDKWWTHCSLDAGHAYLHADERRERAESAIIHALKARGLIPA